MLKITSAATMLAACVVVAIAGCAGMDDQRDYQRHTMSDLQEDWQRPGTLLFEASTSADYPADSDAAEAVRMEWLGAWMRRANLCPGGWEVVSRAQIPASEVHPRRRNLRYEVQCAKAAASEG
ncbi:MAG: hypothetical protein JJU27_00685 [Gammaproteobacteria bacterium]|nr:hypothetical protein [Gammaproteobacteria bacterium]